MKPSGSEMYDRVSNMNNKRDDKSPDDERLIGDDDIGLEDHKLVSDYGLKFGEHLRTGKAKQKRKNPPSHIRRQQKASKLLEELNAIKAKMSPEQRAAFNMEVSEEIALDNEIAEEAALDMEAARLYPSETIWQR